MTEKTLILVSELWQIDRLGSVPNGKVVALDTEVEEALATRGISYISANEYKTQNLGFRDAANAWAVQVLENPAKPFLVYREVPLGRVYFYPLYLYFSRAAYWMDIIASLLERHPEVTKLVVYPSAIRATETTGDLAQEEIDALVDSANLLGAQKGVAVIVPPSPPSTKDFVMTFALKRRLFGCLIGAWNILMRLRPHRPLRILVSDYWRNVGPFMQHLLDAEVVFIDRLQALHAGIGNMWQWRMRFYHLDAFTGNGKDMVWDKEGPKFTANFRGYDVSPFLLSAYRALTRNYVPQALHDIDHAYAMLKQLRPHIIILRVSTAPQTHYPILALSGRALGIPSIEFQHGLEYNGIDSITRRKNAEYVGVYGPIITKELVSAGIAEERITTIGSPRFDVYAMVSTQRTPPSQTQKALNVLCIYPGMIYGNASDTYDIDAFMSGIAEALRVIPDVHLTIKLRGPRQEAYSRRRITEICKDVPHAVVRDTPLTVLFESSDIVISCYSTAMLEAMQSGVPLIFFAATPLEVRFARTHIPPYVTAGVLEFAESKEELVGALRELMSEEARRTLVERASRFLAEDYAFDGRSAERAARLVRRLAKNN